jgi:hypothetical protein
MSVGSALRNLGVELEDAIGIAETIGILASG